MSGADIIQLSAFTSPGSHLFTPRQQWREGRLPLPPPATETAKNSRLRISRRDAWWRASRVVDYRLARMEWLSALRLAQEWAIDDSASFPFVQDELQGRAALVEKWRDAVVKKLLTPAPDNGAVAWKRATQSQRL